MSNFLKSLLKQFHPDNQKSGNKEKFILIKDKIDKKEQINFLLSFSLKEMILGNNSVKLGDEEFLINNGKPLVKDRILGEDFKSKDGTKFHITYSYDNCDPDLDLFLSKDSKYGDCLIKVVEISRFDAIFGGFKFDIDIYGIEKTFEIEVFPHIVNNGEYETTVKIGELPLFIKYKVKATDEDRNFVKMLRKKYNGSGYFKK